MYLLKHVLIEVVLCPGYIKLHFSHFRSDIFLQCQILFSVKNKKKDFLNCHVLLSKFSRLKAESKVTSFHRTFEDKSFLT